MIVIVFHAFTPMKYDDDTRIFITMLRLCMESSVDHAATAVGFPFFFVRAQSSKTCLQHLHSMMEKLMLQSSFPLLQSAAFTKCPLTAAEYCMVLLICRVGLLPDGESIHSESHKTKYQDLVLRPASPATNFLLRKTTKTENKTKYFFCINSKAGFVNFPYQIAFRPSVPDFLPYLEKSLLFLLLHLSSWVPCQ